MRMKMLTAAAGAALLAGTVACSQYTSATLPNTFRGCNLRRAVRARSRRAIEMRLALAALIVAAAACRGAVVTTDPDIKAGGTIAGIVRATEGSVPLVTRKVTAIHVTSGARFETTTGVNGGYTIKVPEEGRYRIQVELREGEVIAKGSEETDINNGDLDSGRDFEITLAASAKKGTL